MRRIGFVILVVVASVMTLMARFKLDPEHEQEMLMDMAYLPNGRMLELISGGMDDTLSDLLWLRSLRYVMDHFDTGRDYTYLYKSFDIITDLDPQFIRAYRFGGYFLSGMTDEYANARDLLKKGWEQNPADWRIVYDLGSVYDLHLKDPLKAAEWFGKLAHLEDCPSWMRLNAQMILEEEGRLDRALAMWDRAYRKTESKKLKKVAAWNINRVRSLIMIEDLKTHVEAYRTQKKVLPASLQEVADAGIIRFVPEDAFGERLVYVRTTARDGTGTFVIDCREIIRRTLDKRIVYYRNLALAPYRRKFGSWPGKLEDLVEKGVIPRLPDTPHGIPLDYDPATGTVSYDKTLERYHLPQ